VRALAAWAIYKIRRVLIASRDGVADLRTECKFEVKERKKSEQKDSEMVEAIDCWIVDQETGKKSCFPLPALGDDLKSEFKSLLSSTSPLKVRWVPNVEGKAELPPDLVGDAIKREGLEAKVKVEEPKQKKGKKQEANKKKFLMLFGEWSDTDKRSLRDQNPDDPAKGIVARAIKDFEKHWETKAQSRKTEKPDAEPEGDGDQE
jgi:hypothetical protein